MNEFCDAYLGWVPYIVYAFFISALLIVILGAAVELIRLYRTPLPQPAEAPAPDGNRDDAPAPALTAPLIDALRQLLESIARGPAWIAMFLAGVGLFYLAGLQYQGICKPSAPQAPPRVVAPVARPAAGNPPAQANTHAAAPGH